MGVGAGDAVLCPSFTFCATAEVAALVGATPVFVDVDAETFNIDANGIAGAVETARQAGLKPKAIIPVDLFGLPADHAAIRAAAAEICSFSMMRRRASARPATIVAWVHSGFAPRRVFSPRSRLAATAMAAP